MRDSQTVNVPPKSPVAGGPPAISAPIMRLQTGTHHDPFEVLGVHAQADGTTVVRVFMPQAEAVEVAGGRMARVAGTDCFERVLAAGSALDAHPVLKWQDKRAGDWHQDRSPYTFAAQIGEVRLRRPWRC